MCTMHSMSLVKRMLNIATHDHFGLVLTRTFMVILKQYVSKEQQEIHGLYRSQELYSSPNAKNP